MHLFALNENGELIEVQAAKRNIDYRCLECQSLVRKRGGEEVQEHFWHLHPRKDCNLSNKSLSHLQTQILLQRLLGSKEAILECRFPAISRIADVAWRSEKIIFEVQLSPITAKEVQSRNSDYATLGWQVVWILHTKRFGKRKVTAAEKALTDSPHYFCNINREGKGDIFDQIDHKPAGLRRAIIEKTPFWPTHPIRDRVEGPRGQWQLHFAGDLTMRADLFPVKSQKISPLFLYNRLLNRLLRGRRSPYF